MQFNYFEIPFIVYCIIQAVIFPAKLYFNVTRRIKPFDCTFCLSGWVTIIALLIAADFNLWPTVFINMCIGGALERWL